MNDYRFTARAESPCGPSGRRLNNFVTELVRTGLKDGEVRFFRPEEGWVWIAFDGTDGKAVGFVDGEASPSVRRRPDERLTEAVRWVKAGWHVLRVKDAACGGLRIHAVKNLAQSACLLDFGPCDFSGECYKMTYPFWRRFVLPSLTVVNNAYRVIRRRPADLDAFRARGMGIWGEISIKFSSPLWLDVEGQWKALMDSDWGRGYDASVDESAIGAQRLQRVTGLEPGKLYALHFCAPNRADLKTPAKEVPPLAFRARLEGAEELAGLRFRHMAVNTKDKAAAKEGRCVHLPIYRYVFRAKASEATLVFEDRGEDGSAAPAGTEQILNYVIFRPYYVEAPGEADEIAAFMAPPREASADKRR